MFPLSHQEIARARHADLLRAATKERLATTSREGTEWPESVRAGALRLTAVVHRVSARRPAVRTA